MNPLRAQNIHNYSVRFTPSQQFSLEDLTSVGLIEQIANQRQPITLRRATYDAATDTVLLVANESLGPNGAYTVGSAPSLSLPGNRPHKARALTDLEGNPLEEEDGGGGVFSINISKGHPYAVGGTRSFRRKLISPDRVDEALLAPGCSFPHPLGLIWDLIVG